jgi:hypothetical protein
LCQVEEGSPAWQALAKKNEYDIRLYESIVQIFDEQREIIKAHAGQLSADEDGHE